MGSLASTPQAALAPPLAYDPSWRHPLVEAVLARLAPGVDAAIHAGDEMLAFLDGKHGGDRDQGLAVYFRSGHSAFDVVERLVLSGLGGWERVGSLLDFASGYGRVARFLARALPPERVWVADVYADGVRFQAERLGVHGLVSTARPEDFACDRTFDVVNATSLFTHLPRAAFEGWLARLLALVAPGGLLVFTAHDQSLLLPDQTRPEEGLVFQRVSESGSLAADEYGSAWVTEAYVRGVVARASGGRAGVVRFPLGLCNLHDVYAVAPGSTDLSRLGIEPEPDARLERCVVDSGRLALSGWAFTRPPGSPVAAVRALLDGAPLADCRDLHERPDVAAMFGGPSLSGWGLEGPLPPGLSRSAAVLVVESLDAAGRARLLWAGSLEAALGESARCEAAALGRRVAELERRASDLTAHLGWARTEAEIAAARLAAMEASRFWKLRRAWFRVKRALGLTREI